jgi:hypothetical protein
MDLGIEFFQQKKIDQFATMYSGHVNGRRVDILEVKHRGVDYTCYLDGNKKTTLFTHVGRDVAQKMLLELKGSLR